MQWKQTNDESGLRKLPNGLIYGANQRTTSFNVLFRQLIGAAQRPNTEEVVLKSSQSVILHSKRLISRELGVMGSLSVFRVLDISRF